MNTYQTPFETERTRSWRAMALDPGFQRTIDDIESRGHHVIQLNGEGDLPHYSYTVGLSDDCPHAEIIVLGLPPAAALDFLDSAAELQRRGVTLRHGRHPGLISGVDCEFRPVDQKWIEHIMRRARWFYSGELPPVLQAVYPDRQNRFPEEPGFDERFRTPLLQPHRLWTALEEDFWAANDPTSSLFDWKFPDPPHTPVFLSETVHRGEEAVTYVAHSIEDGAWQLLGDRMAEGGGPVLSCFHHQVDRDPSLIELADLPLGAYAIREKPGERWFRHQQERASKAG